MEPTVHFVTLAVPDVEAARRFYLDGLGWHALLDVPGEIVFVQVGPGLVLGLFDAAAFRRDLRPTTPPTPATPATTAVPAPYAVEDAQLTLSHNVDSDAEVVAVLEQAQRAGATIVKPAQRAAFGGYHGHFADPAGFVWEVCHNPWWSVDDEGQVRLGSASADATRATVAVVGVGAMGGAFARHLLEAGHAVVVHDVDPDRRVPLVELGARDAATLEDVARAGTDVIVLSLPSEAAFAAVTGELARAVPAAGPSRPIVVDTSTLGLAAKDAGRERLAAVDLTLLDCPVSGTAAQADARDLVIFASGPPEVIEACSDVLDAFSRRVHTVGPFGDGSRMKLLANLLVAVHNAAAAEMLAVARRVGIDPMLALEAIGDGAGNSRMLEVRGPSMAAREYGKGMSIELFAKDLDLIGSFAHGAGVGTPLFDAVVTLYREAAAAGWGATDTAAVHEVYLRKS